MSIISMYMYRLQQKFLDLREMKVTKGTGSPMGGEAKYYFICEMYYDSIEAFKSRITLSQKEKHQARI